MHQNHYVLSFAFAFEKEDEIYQFAIAPPYSYSRLTAYLTALDTKYHGKFVKTTICRSLVNVFSSIALNLESKKLTSSATTKTGTNHHRSCVQTSKSGFTAFHSNHCGISTFTSRRIDNIIRLPRFLGIFARFTSDRWHFTGKFCF